MTDASPHNGHIITYEWWDNRGHYFECSCGWLSQPSEKLDTAEQAAHIHAVETGDA